MQLVVELLRALELILVELLGKGGERGREGEGGMREGREREGGGERAEGEGRGRNEGGERVHSHIHTSPYTLPCIEWGMNIPYDQDKFKVGKTGTHVDSVVLAIKQ